MATIREPAWAKHLREAIAAARADIALVAGEVHHVHDHLVQQGVKMSDLSTSVDDLSDKVAAIGAAIEAEVAQLADAVGAAADVAPQVERIRQLAGTLQGGVDALAADDPAAPPAL